MSFCNLFMERPSYLFTVNWFIGKNRHPCKWLTDLDVCWI